MSPRVALLTASMPERAGMLAEAIGTVAAQSVLPKQHLVGVDHRRQGAALTYNGLAKAVCCAEWLTFLDDDDLLDPGHLEVLGDATSPSVDVVYAHCRTDAPHLADAYQGPFDPVALADRCTVPITAMVRKDWFEKVGGFPSTWAYDWDLWKNLSAAGARFLAVDAVTWTYRIHGGNRSWQPEGSVA